MSDKKQCPEFPHFGARYPDARCIDGYLWDLDKCDGDQLYGGGNDPCPFCNTEAFIEYHEGDEGESPTREEIEKHIAALRLKYEYPD
jgi:hypothetical protein